MTQFQTVGAVLVGIAVFIAGAVFQSATGSPSVGATPGTDHYVRENYAVQPTFGGLSCLATSTTAAVGTLPNLRDDVNCVDFTVNVADVTLTLMASTSAWYPTRVNESRTLRIRNATTTATADIIIAAGTGINLKTASSTAGKFTIWGDTGADNYSVITFTRQADSDLNAELISFTD